MNLADDVIPELGDDILHCSWHGLIDRVEALTRPLAGDPTELILGQSVAALTEEGERVRVELTGGTSREFDLVFGADGLHSRIRELVFGPEADFATDLGMAAAAFDIDGRWSSDEPVATMYGELGMQAARVTRREGRSMVLLTFRHDGAVPTERAEQEAFLTERMAGAGWDVPASRPTCWWQ